MSDILVLLPDVERLLSEFLRDQPEVTDLLAARVYTVLPRDKEFPLLRLVRLGGYDEQICVPLVIDEAVVQMDVWGGPKALAYQAAATVRAVLSARLIGGHDEGVVQNIRHGALRYLPDEEFTPARPRYTFDVTVRTRAHPAIGS